MRPNSAPTADSTEAVGRKIAPAASKDRPLRRMGWPIRCRHRMPRARSSRDRDRAVRRERVARRGVEPESGPAKKPGPEHTEEPISVSASGGHHAAAGGSVSGECRPSCGQRARIATNSFTVTLDRGPGKPAMQSATIERLELRGLDPGCHCEDAALQRGQQGNRDRTGHPRCTK